MTTNSISNISNHINPNPEGINDIVDSFGHLGGVTSQQARDIITFHQPSQHIFTKSLLDCWARARHLAEAVELLGGKSHLVEWIGLEGLERGAENCVLINGKATATKERAGKNYLKKVEKKLRAQLRGKNIVFAGNITTINDYISKEQMEELRELPAEQQERAVKMSAQSFRNISHTSTIADFLSRREIGRRTKGEMIKITTAKPTNKTFVPSKMRMAAGETFTMLIIDDDFVVEGHSFINKTTNAKLAMVLGTQKKLILLPIVGDKTTDVVGAKRWDVATTCEVFEQKPDGVWMEFGGEWDVEVLSPAPA